MTRLASVSVDLDEIPNYFSIYGLPAPAGSERHAVYDVALDRLSSFARAEGLPLTLFAIGSDLVRPESASRLRAAREAGHEIANHSQDHPYDLVRLGRDAIRGQIVRGAETIRAATGAAPAGFRAPGYTVTDEVFRILEELEVGYDASVFPCPAYWAAKAVAISWIGLSGRTSRSIVDHPSVLFSPTQPYRVGDPYWRRGNGIREIPVQVTRGPRLPFIGTTVTLAGPTRARWLARMCVGDPVVNLELHGIDVLDATDGLEALRPHQQDVRVPWAAKLEALHAAIDVLRSAGYAFTTMAEVAAQV